MSTPTDTMRSDEPVISKKQKKEARGVVKIPLFITFAGLPSCGPKINVYRVNVQLRTSYTGPDAADRHEWGLLEAR